jgi:DNA-binding MarR family transcriptional regulator
MSPVPWLSEREQRAWRAFLAMQRQLIGRTARDLQRDTGLSGADYEVLVNLSEAPEGRLRAFELGAATQWEKSRLSHHITRMVERGLVRRESCPTDSRGAFVVLTAAGRKAIEAAAPLHVEHVRRVFIDSLTPEQLDALAEISDAILAKVDEEPKPCPDEDCPVTQTAKPTRTDS